jgi:hypothetical protein
MKKNIIFFSVLFMFSWAVHSQQLLITSFSPTNGVITWSNSLTNMYHTLEVSESLNEEWRTAPYYQFRNMQTTGNVCSADLPLIHEYADIKRDDAVSGHSLFMRLISHSEPINIRDTPTSNTIIFVNNSSTSVSNIQLNMVGSADTAFISALPAGFTSSNLLFNLPERPTVNPISWSDFSGSYQINNEEQYISVILPQLKTKIIICDDGYYLW